MALVFDTVLRWIEVSSRPSDWRRAAEKWKRSHPFCAICGDKKNLEAHDIIPYRVDPDAWRSGENFITLDHDCHRRFGHCRDPSCKMYNRLIVELSNVIQDYIHCIK
jgi:5-methylcytosine-specific restriction endonuclease McrA